MNTRTYLENEKILDFSVDPRLSKGTKAFLKVLNSSGGPPLESLPPIQAREGLVQAQASVLSIFQALKSRRRRSKSMATQSNLTSYGRKGAKVNFLSSSSFTAAGGYLAITQLTSGW